MDLRSVINHGEISNLALGVNILYADGVKTITYCLLKKQKQLLTLVKRGSFTGNELPEDIALYVQKSVRLHINLQGSGLLAKEIGSALNASEQDLLKLLPGLDAANFVIQYHAGKASQVTLIRKDDQFFQTPLLQAGNVTTISLGTAILENVAPLLPDMDLYIPFHKVSIRSGIIEHVSSYHGDTVNISLEIGDASLSTSELLAYASALNVFVPMALPIQGCEWIQHNAKHYLEKENLFKTGRITLFITIVALLLNASLYFKLKSDIASKSDFIAVNGKNILKTNAAYKKQQDLLKAYHQLGWKLNRIPLFYFDQLAASKPLQIQFTSMECGALDEDTYRKTRNLIFNATVLKISGDTQEPHVLMAWINILTKMDWIEAIEDQKYSYETLRHTGHFSFTIKVKNP